VLSLYFDFTVTDIKLVLAPEKHPVDEYADGEQIEDQTSNVDSDYLAQDFDQHREGSEMDTGQSYDENRGCNENYLRPNQNHRSSARNRWKRLPHRIYSSRPSVSSPTSDFHRRQTETLEVRMFDDLL